MTMEMTDALRQRACGFMWSGGLKVGGDRVVPDIRAAIVQDDGTLCRTVNGSIMPPGTALFVGPDNEPAAETIEALLAVIDAQAAEIRSYDARYLAVIRAAVAGIPRYDNFADCAHNGSGYVEVNLSTDGDWMKADEVFNALSITPL